MQPRTRLGDARRAGRLPARLGSGHPGAFRVATLGDALEATSARADAAEEPAAPLSLRIRVRATRARLDRTIAAQWPCEADPALGLRARQLLAPDTRRQIARQLRGVVAYVGRGGDRPVLSPVVINRRAVLADRDVILDLAQRLHDAPTVNPRGVALTQLLLTDGVRSPLFNARCGRTIAEAIQEVTDTLPADSAPHDDRDALV